MSEDDFHEYQKVRKKRGYKYPGVIVSVFWTLGGAKRYVVEATGIEYQGMLHIFNGDQLEENSEKETDGSRESSTL